MISAVNMLITYLKMRMSAEDGQDLIEYALLSGLIAATLIGIGAFAAFTGALDGMANGIGNCIDFDNSVGSECDPI